MDALTFSTFFKWTLIELQMLTCGVNIFLSIQMISISRVLVEEVKTLHPVTIADKFLLPLGRSFYARLVILTTKTSGLPSSMMMKWIVMMMMDTSKPYHYLFHADDQIPTYINLHIFFYGLNITVNYVTTYTHLQATTNLLVNNCDEITRGYFKLL